MLNIQGFLEYGYTVIQSPRVLISCIKFFTNSFEDDQNYESFLYGTFELAKQYRHTTHPLNRTHASNIVHRMAHSALYLSDQTQLKYVKWNPRFSTFLTLDVDICDIWCIFQRKNPRIKIWLGNLWNIFLLISYDVFWFILYYPGFYSSLSDKKQRNDRMFKII